MHAFSILNLLPSLSWFTNQSAIQYYMKKEPEKERERETWLYETQRFALVLNNRRIELDPIRRPIESKLICLAHEVAVNSPYLFPFLSIAHLAIFAPFSSISMLKTASNPNSNTYPLEQRNDNDQLQLRRCSSILVVVVEYPSWLKGRKLLFLLMLLLLLLTLTLTLTLRFSL